MKLWNSLGPNPRVVRMFLLEKGVEVPFEEVDIMAGENRQDAYLAKNSNGEMPCLELDDGSPITEVTAICEYLEERHPTPALLGATPEARAHTRMWTRRVDLNIVEPLTQGFRYAEGQPMFKGRRHLIPQAADDLKAIARENLAKLDGWIAGRDFVAGDAFSLADIHLYAFLDFGAGVGQPLDGANANLTAWFERVASRPSAEGSLHPVAKAGGMRA